VGARWQRAARDLEVVRARLERCASHASQRDHAADGFSERRPEGAPRSSVVRAVAAAVRRSPRPARPPRSRGGLSRSQSIAPPHGVKRRKIAGHRLQPGPTPWQKTWASGAGTQPREVGLRHARRARTDTMMKCALPLLLAAPVGAADARSHPLGTSKRLDPTEGFLGTTPLFQSDAPGPSTHRALQLGDACADLNADGEVGVADLLLLLASFNGGAAGDIDGNGLTDVSDLLSLLGQFGQPCSTEERTCAPLFSGPDHACRGDHSYAGAAFSVTEDADSCQAACMADAACTGGSFFSGDTGTVQWQGDLQVAFADGCYLFGAAGSWPHFDLCPEHWSIYSNPAVTSFECASVSDATVVYPYMVDDSPEPNCGAGFYLNSEWNRNPPDWFHRSVVSGIIARDFGAAWIEYPIPFAWPCWVCPPGSFPGEGCSTESWYHGDLNRNSGWGRPTPGRDEPCCVKCAINMYDDDLDPTTPCVACPAGKHTDAVGSGYCFDDACPDGQCGVAPLATAGDPLTLADVSCAASVSDCVVESWNSATDSPDGEPVLNADGDSFTLYKLQAQPANTFYGSEPNTATGWPNEHVGGMNYCTGVDPTHQTCDPTGDITAAAKRYADLCFAAGLRPVTWGELRYYPGGEWGYTTCDLAYNCVPLIDRWQYNELEHATMDWVNEVTGWDRFMMFFPSSGAPPATANKLINYNSASFSNMYGTDYSMGWNREESWAEEWHPICATVN
jgi:hypothetical protein